MRTYGFIAFVLLVNLFAGIAPISTLAQSDKELRLHSDGGPWRYIPAENADPALPRIVLIGDSIMNGYRANVIRALDGRATIDCWLTPVHLNSPNLFDDLATVLAQGPYDVVHFNIGLHGWPPGRIDDDDYEPLLRRYVSVVQEGAPNARWIWASITPITVQDKPTQLEPVHNDTIVKRNAIAQRVISDMGVEINDLYGLMVDRLKLARGDRFHWQAQGYALMAKQIVANIQPALAGDETSATTVYVSPTGNDTNSGTLSSPLRTLEAAGQHGADVIVLRGGTYRLERTLVLGPKHSNQTWRAYKDEVPVISGGVPVTNWRKDERGRYRATVDVDNFRQMWVNGRRARRARGPAPADLKFWGTNHATVRKYDNPPGLTGTPGYQPGRLDRIEPAGFTTSDVSLASWKNPDAIEFGFYSSWSHKIAKVAKITRADDRVIIEMAQPGFFLCNRAGGAVARMPAYMENALELLDEPGEWYFHRPAGMLYYLPRADENLHEAQVIVPRLEKLLEVRDASDIRFEGITFAHATWLRPSTSLAHPEAQATFIQPVDNGYFRPEHEKGWVPVNGEHVKSPANVVVDASRGIRFSRCTFAALGGAGLDLQHGAQANVVEGCRFEDIAANGIQVGDLTREDHHPSSPDRVVKDNRIANNVITRTGRDYNSGVGVFVGYTEGTVIAHNEIFDVPYSGISIGWGWGMPDAGGGVYVDPVKWDTPTSAKNNRIEYNHIHHMMQKLNDGAGVYTLGRMPGTIIRGNHIHDGGKSPLSGGVYLDEGSAEIEVTGNLIYRMPRPLMFNNHNQNRRATCPVHDNLHMPPGNAEGVKGVALRGGAVIDEPLGDTPAEFTITAWIRLDEHPHGSDARRWIFCRETNEWADRNISLLVDGAHLSGSLNIGGGQDNVWMVTGTGKPLPLNAWTPIALTYDGDTLRIYRDGREVGATEIGKAYEPGGAAVTIGARSDRYALFECGDIDEVRLFDRALTPAEVGRADESAGNLVRHWDMEIANRHQLEAKRIAEKAGLQPPYRDLLTPR